jgi:hypothetical protein
VEDTLGKVVKINKIFFTERNELTDDEIFNNISNESSPKVNNPGLDYFVQKHYL